jgi:hypothetical protein
MLKHAHLIHRGELVMKEREIYYDRRMHAVTTNRIHGPRILSFILDGEDSGKTGLPHYGTQHEFTKKLGHHITGVKVLALLGLHYVYTISLSLAVYLITSS